MDLDFVEVLNEFFFASPAKNELLINQYFKQELGQ